MLYCCDELLNSVDFFLIEVGFATLRADPCRNLVKRHVTTLAVGVKRGVASFHLALTVDALHFFILTVKSFDHPSESGMYAVITAKKSCFGAQTI